jgi:hypothetical protein
VGEKRAKEGGTEGEGRCVGRRQTGIFAKSTACSQRDSALNAGWPKRGLDSLQVSVMNYVIAIEFHACMICALQWYVCHIPPFYNMHYSTWRLGPATGLESTSFAVRSDKCSSENVSRKSCTVDLMATSAPMTKEG